MLPDFGGGHRAFLKIRSGRRSLYPEDQVEETGVGEHLVQVEAKAVALAPEGDEFFSVENLFRLVQKALPGANHVGGDLGLWNHRVLPRIGKPLVVIVGKIQKEAIRDRNCLAMSSIAAVAAAVAAAAAAAARRLRSPRARSNRRRR